MSIHKSKGLEFPVVILADTNKQFNRTDISQPLVIHPQLGLGPKRTDKRRRIEYTTLARMAVQSKLTGELLAEELRVLYVAMTRARDRLYIYGFNNTKEPPADAWHTTLSRVLPEHPDAKIDTDGIVRIQCGQDNPVAKITSTHVTGPITPRDSISSHPVPDLHAKKPSFGQKSPVFSQIMDKTAPAAPVSELLRMRAQKKYATNTGKEVHHRLQHIIIGDEGDRGDPELIGKIRKSPKLAAFFGKNSRAEVPIAGTIDGKFISRRIDRLIITADAIEFLDFKTDVDKDARREKYAAQMAEYAALLHAACPGRIARGHILWLHDWELEEVTLV